MIRNKNVLIPIVGGFHVQNTLGTSQVCFYIICLLLLICVYVQVQLCLCTIVYLFKAWLMYLWWLLALSASLESAEKEVEVVPYGEK